MCKTSYIWIIALCLSFFGCSNENETTNSEIKPPSPIVTPPSPGDDTSRDTNDTSRTVNTVTLAGVTLNITIQGSLAPNAVLDVSLVQTAGRPATAFRVWIGDESGVGSIKTKTHSHGNSSHVHARAPATLPANCAVWIEVQNAEGERESGSVGLD